MTYQGSERLCFFFAFVCVCVTECVLCAFMISSGGDSQQRLQDDDFESKKWPIHVLLTTICCMYW